MNAELQHYGIKGMRWGVRKQSEKPSVDLNGIKVGRDGSISIAKGAELQRVAAKGSNRLGLGDQTYASFGSYDNARYVKYLGGGNDPKEILSIKATQPIKAPSLEEATRIHSELMVSSKEFRAVNTNAYFNTISEKNLEKLKTDPTGRFAKELYATANEKLALNQKADANIPEMQRLFREGFAKQGYNAVRDENDVMLGLSKAPIIVFNPQKSLKVVRMTDITDRVRKANKETLKQYKRSGKSWLESQLYS